MRNVSQTSEVVYEGLCMELLKTVSEYMNFT